MALFGPNTTNALAAGFEGAGLQQQLLNRALQNRQAQQTVDAEAKKRAAQALLGQAIQKATGRSGVPNIPLATAPALPSGGTMAQPAQGAQPGAVSVSPLPAPGSQPGALPNMSAGAAPAAGATAPGAASLNPAAPGGNAQPDKKFQWEDVARTLRNMRGADPETVALALDMMTTQLNQESERGFKGEQNELNREMKRQQQIRDLQWRYEREQDITKRQLMLKDIDRLIAEGRNDTQRDIAGQRNATQLELAQANNDARLRQTLAGTNSRERIAANALAWEQEYGNATLDQKADQIGKNFLLKERELELRDRGMQQKEAQFYAKLEQTEALALARDATARRGQDLLMQGKQLAAAGKLDAQRIKLDTAMEAATVNFDKIYQAAERLIKMPGLDNATGPIDVWLPTVQGDTADFEEAVKSLQAMVGFQELAAMRAASPTGGALGNVSNKEVEFLQATIRSLSLRQTADTFVDNMRAIMDNANQGKTRMLKAYERYAAPPATGTSGAGVPSNPRTDAPTIPLPSQAATEPDGTVFRIKKGGPRYMKQGDKAIELQ